MAKTSKPHAVRVREAAGLSQRRFAAELGISQKHWNQIENGHAHIGGKTARALGAHFAEALDGAGVNLLDLLEE